MNPGTVLQPSVVKLARGLMGKIISKKLIGETEDGIKIYLVDGGEVRDNIDVEFGLGAHSLCRDYIPEDEIWIENLPSVEDMEANLAHELIEYYLMKYVGMGYQTAHGKAREIERRYRRLEKTGSIKKTSQGWRGTISTILKRLLRGGRLFTRLSRLGVPQAAAIRGTALSPTIVAAPTQEATLAAIAPSLRAPVQQGATIAALAPGLRRIPSPGVPVPGVAQRLRVAKRLTPIPGDIPLGEHYNEALRLFKVTPLPPQFADLARLTGRPVAKTMEAASSFVPPFPVRFSLIGAGSKSKAPK